MCNKCSLTYLLTTRAGCRYVLQKLSTYIDSLQNCLSKMVFDSKSSISLFLCQKSCLSPSTLNRWLPNSPSEFLDHIWSRLWPQPLTFWSQNLTTSSLSSTVSYTVSTKNVPLFIFPITVKNYLILMLFWHAAWENQVRPTAEDLQYILQAATA